jgi:hypothetical protein
MTGKYNAQDLRRLARYNKILEICKNQTTAAQLEDYLPCTYQMLRWDCRHLTEMGYLKTNKINAGKYNLPTLHYKSLKSKYDESKLEPIHMRKRQVKAAKDIALQKEKDKLPPNVRIIPERMVMSVRSKVGKHHISGSSMSGSTW